MQNDISEAGKRSMGEALILPYQNRVSPRSIKTSKVLMTEFSELAIEARYRNGADDLAI